MLKEKTFALLMRYGVPLEQIKIFVVEEELEAYWAAFPGVEIVVGVLGLVPQRRLIYQWCQDDEIVMMDDDVQAILGMDRQPVQDFVGLCKRGFLECKERGLRLWSVCPVDNNFFYRETVSVNLKFCIGSFFGLVKRGEMPHQPETFKEDVYRTCAYYKEDGGVVRLNWAGVKTSYARGTGGLNESRTIEKMLKGAEEVVKAFPEYATLYYRKRNGHPEIRLKAAKKVSFSPHIVLLPSPESPPCSCDNS